MGTQFTRHNGRGLALHSVIAVLFGLATFLSDDSLTTLTLLFGIYALANGLWALITSWLDHNNLNHRWTFQVKGLTGIAIGGFASLRPNSTAPVLFSFIVVWALLTGILEAITVFELRDVVEREQRRAWNSLIRRQALWDNPSERKIQRMR